MFITQLPRIIEQYCLVSGLCQSNKTHLVQSKGLQIQLLLVAKLVLQKIQSLVFYTLKVKNMVFLLRISLTRSTSRTKEVPTDPEAVVSGGIMRITNSFFSAAAEARVLNFFPNLETVFFFLLLKLFFLHTRI